jgi:pyruvate/2-oxoglutarate/acetoin dehydrogenase E1 component
MAKILERIVKIIEKNCNYYILREEKNYLIVGTSIMVKLQKEYSKSIFSPVTKIIDKEIPVFFLITIDNEVPQLTKDIKKSLPILDIKQKETLNLERLEELLVKFVLDNF